MDEEFDEDKFYEEFEKALPSAIDKFKWGKTPMTRQQQWKLKQLGVKFNKAMTRGEAFLLIRKEVMKKWSGQ